LSILAVHCIESAQPVSLPGCERSARRQKPAGVVDECGWPRRQPVEGVGAQGLGHGAQVAAGGLAPGALGRVRQSGGQVVKV
jgi:hypothetical protein